MGRRKSLALSEDDRKRRLTPTQKLGRLISATTATTSPQNPGETSAGAPCVTSAKHSPGGRNPTTAIAPAAIAGLRLIPALHITSVITRERTSDAVTSIAPRINARVFPIPSTNGNRQYTISRGGVSGNSFTARSTIASTPAFRNATKSRVSPR